MVTIGKNSKNWNELNSMAHRAPKLIFFAKVKDAPVMEKMIQTIGEIL